jgi:hypothetical protein
VSKSTKSDGAPKNLVEAIARLKAELDAAHLVEVRNADEHMSEFHFTLGMRLRNAWGLWSNDPLPTWFVERGVPHPDDMSEVILRSLWRDLHGLPPLIDEDDLDDPPPVELADPYELVFSAAPGAYGVLQWIKDVGDDVEMGDIVARVTTDDGVVPIVANATGTLGQIKIDQGEAVMHAAVIGVIERQ